MDDKLIRFYTELIFVSHPPEKADVILVPGSDTEALGQKAAQLWKEGFAPVILVSGKYSIMKNGFTVPPELAQKYPEQYETEADFLEAVMEKNGVPKEAVWKEKTATYRQLMANRLRLGDMLAMYKLYDLL